MGQAVQITNSRDLVGDEERIADAVSYMKEKYGTSMFDKTDEYATVGDLRRALVFANADRVFEAAENDNLI